jgi:uncharacterized membrane protein YeaQ/YmgE (transglycosylase-associated protein family)
MLAAVGFAGAPARAHAPEQFCGWTDRFKMGLGAWGWGGSMNVGSFIAALALGFVAGAIARALIPNDAFRHMHGWRSWLTSTGLGLLGALVGFWIFHGLFGIGDTNKFDWGGIVGAVIGAMIVVAVASFLIKRFAKHPAV